MEFEEVSRLVRHAPAPLAATSPFGLALHQQQHEQHVNAVNVNSYFHDFPYPALIPALHKKRQLTAKLVESMRRLKKSAIKSEEPLTSEEDYGARLPSTDSRAHLLSRLKRGSGKSAGVGQTGYDDADADQVWRSRRRTGTKRKHVMFLSGQQEQLRRRSRRNQRKNHFAEPSPIQKKMNTIEMQQIRDQMRSFCVPPNWASLERPSVAVPQRVPLTADKLLESLTGEVERLQFLIDREQAKIEMNRQEIREHVAKLEELDRNVGALNAKIGLVRSEELKQMSGIMQETRQRLPLLREARSEHQRIVSKIEDYNQRVNCPIRLSKLKETVVLARQRQDFWSSIHEWTPPIVISLVSALIGLLMFYF